MRQILFLCLLSILYAGHGFYMTLPAKIPHKFHQLSSTENSDGNNEVPLDNNLFNMNRRVRLGRSKDQEGMF